MGCDTRRKRKRVNMLKHTSEESRATGVMCIIHLLSIHIYRSSPSLLTFLSAKKASVSERAREREREKERKRERERARERHSVEKKKITDYIYIYKKSFLCVEV